jgi:hypothetical protein
VYACGDCAIKAALTGLDTDNSFAWTVWQRVAHRVVVELQAGGYVLSLALADLSARDALACVQRLAIIYDILSPAPTPKD